MPGSCYLFPFREQIDELSTAHLRGIPDGCMEEAGSMDKDDGGLASFSLGNCKALKGTRRNERGRIF